MTMSYRVLKGSTNVSVTIRIIDSTAGTPETAVEHNTAGMAMEYRREGAASTAITEVALAALTTAHTDGGIEHIGNGYYRFDVPDAAFATGVTGVLVHGTVTGMVVIGAYVHLVDVNDQDAVRMGLTALPNAAADAAGGLPISDAGGLALDTKLANTNEITVARMGALTDWINGGRLDLLLDAIPTTAMRGTDSALTDKAGFSLSTAGILAVWHQALTAVVTAGSVGKLLKDEITSVRMATLTDWINGGRLDLLLDAIPTTAMRGTDNALLAASAPTNFGDLSISATTGLVDITQTAADKAWGTTARVLTAGTNIALAKGTGVTGFTDLSAAQVNSEIDTALATTTYAEPIAVPAATASLKDKIGWLCALARNKITQTATTQTLRNDADLANIATSTVSDDATTFTRGEYT